MDGGGARAGDRRACARRGRGGRRPAAAGLAVARDAPRHAQHGPEPDPRDLPRRPPVVVQDPARDLLDPGDRRRRAPPTSARPTRSFYAIDRDGNERWRFGTGGIIDAAAALGRRRERGRVPDHDRLRRRDALPAAQLEPRALAGQADPLALPHPAAAGDRASSSTGGRATSPTGPTRTSTSATPAAAPTRSPPTASSAGSPSAPTRSGRRRPSTPPATATGARSTSTRSRSTRRATSAGRRSRPATSPPRRRSAPTAPSTSARSTARCTRSTRRPAPSAGRFPTADHIYSSPALASDAAGNTTAIYIGSADGSVYARRARRPASCGATTPATRSAPRR